mmetsp:Transcript_5109/g.4321  ORF Transcript_5109/g.4321 Transcript_5109/m.4321 type:complete len:82 (+) Transcript_5109:292-537(+)
MKEKMQDIDFDEEIIEAFRIFDNDGGDTLTLSKVKEILNQAQPKLEQAEINMIIKMVDEKTGMFSYEKFVRENSYSYTKKD